MDPRIMELIEKHPNEPLFKIVYRYLFHEIIMLRIVPNEKINISDIAESLNLSRTPVNNAVSLLIARGLVARDENGHPTVCAPKAYDMFNVCAAREVIEVQAAIQLCASYKDKTAKELKKINNEFAEGLLRHDFERVLEHDLKFHRLIVSESPNPLLLTMYDAISDELERYLSYCTYRLTKTDISQRVIESSTNHHNMILLALDTRSPVNVEAVLKRHLAFGARRLLPNPRISLE